MLMTIANSLVVLPFEGIKGLPAHSREYNSDHKVFVLQVRGYLLMVVVIRNLI